MRKTLRKWNRAAVLGLCAALALSGRSYGDVISEKVPAGALAVVKFNNVAATSGKVAKLAEQLGINMFVPQLNDPLGALKQQLKITGGLKDDGEIAFVVANNDPDPNKRMFALIPTSDYKALIANLEGAQTEGNVTSFKGEDGQTVYVADWGGYAALGPAKELVGGAVGTGLKLPARAAKETTENDVALFANFAALREPIQKALGEERAKNRQDVLDKLKAENQVPAQYHPALAAAFDQAMSAVDSFVRDADAATIGLTLTDAGIRQNVVAEFKQGSYLAKLADGFKPAEGASLVTGLPAGKYLGFGGFSNSPTALNQLIDDVTGPIVAALPKDDEKVAFVPGYLADLKTLVTEIKGQSFGLVTPTAPIGQGALIQPIGVMQGDATKILASMKSFNEKHGAAMNNLMAASQPGMEMKQSFAAGARTVGGVSFDSMTTEITGDSPQANQQRQAMQFVYGAPTVDAFFGNADGKVVSFVGAIPDETVQGLIDAAKANATPLAGLEPVKLVADQLPASRFAEAYVGVDEIVGVALRAAAQFGFLKANSVQLPPDLPPIGLSLASEGGALEYRAFVSSDLLQALVSAGMQVAAQMQGGGEGQRGGGGL